MRTMASKRLATLTILSVLLVGGPATAGPGEPLGPPFSVTSGGVSWAQPGVGRDAAGNFLAVWLGPKVQARRYYADGTPQGPEFDAVPPALASFNEPKVAMSAAGDYVLAWRGQNAEGSHEAILAQSFRADGTPRSPVLEAGRFTQGQGKHDVAMNADGRFVVVWNDVVLVQAGVPMPGFGGATYSVGYSTVRARRFELDGSAEAGNILVGSSVFNPTPLTGSHTGRAPVVAMDAQGNFVVVWQDKGPTSSVIYQRRYKASGAAAGLPTLVGSTIPVGVFAPAVAMASDGRYTIAWMTGHSTGNNSSSGYDLWARRYSAAGTGQGPAFRVNASGIGVADYVSLAMAPDGDAVIAWLGSPGNLCCTPQELSLQSYAADGTPQGGKVSVTPATIIGSAAPAVAMDGYGNPVVLWRESGVLKGRLYQAW